MAPLIRFGLLLLVATLFSSAVSAAPLRTKTELLWIEEIEQQAIDSGIAPNIVHEALDSFAPNPRVVELDQKQPESAITFRTYFRNVVTPLRVKKGANLLDQYATELQDIETRTGVPSHVVVALWGIESSFGQNMGDFDTVNALATLAYEGRRASFFRSELFAALRILERERLSADALRGSWAGAMGQCQFMPSTYLRYGVDGNEDGRIDIWNTPADALASIAHYLAAEGWKNELTWGREVDVEGIPIAEIGLTKSRPLREWAHFGVTNADGSSLPRRDLRASLIQPDGKHGPSYLVYDNFRALMRWNKSTYFALSVGQLADGIKSY